MRRHPRSLGEDIHLRLPELFWATGRRFIGFDEPPGHPSTNLEVLDEAIEQLARPVSRTSRCRNPDGVGNGSDWEPSSSRRVSASGGSIRMATATPTTYLVRRVFGAVSGLLAGLVLAITPICVAVDRDNLPDTALVFVLLLAAWALSRAAETGRLGLLLLATALVGVGFNVKMLAAFVVLPTFYLCYFAAAPVPFSRKQLIAQAVLTTEDLEQFRAVSPER
jgi:Dolichyl-phosphate-mannose-protein mannosyltransferase